MNEKSVEELLIRLCNAHAPSGREDQAADLIFDELRSFTDEVFRARDGSVTAHIAGKSREKRFMFISPMDEPGFMVRSYTDAGLLRISPLGDSRVWHLIGRRVVFICEPGEILGFVGTVPIHLSDAAVPKYDDLYVDIGAASRVEAESAVPLGTFGTLDSEAAVFGLHECAVRARALITRAGCAALCAAARRVSAERQLLPFDVYFSFTCRSLLKLSGVGAPVWRYTPTDTIFVGSAAAAPVPKAAVRCGDGVVIDLGSDSVGSDGELSEFLCRTAEAANLRWRRMAVPDSGSAVPCINETGCRTACVRIPVRYLSSASSVSVTSDVAETAELLCRAAFDSGKYRCN